MQHYAGFLVMTIQQVKQQQQKKEKAEGNRLWLLLFKVFLYTGRQPHNFYPF